MATSPNKPDVTPGGPPPQHHFEDAARAALRTLLTQDEEQLRWLGAERADHGWAVPVLDGRLTVDLDSAVVRTASGDPAGRQWRILTLHYLGTTTQPVETAPAVTFADLPIGRTYAPVYQGRVISRLVHTAGRDADTLAKAAGAVGGVRVDAGDLAFDFRIYPRVVLRLVWYAGDDELPPSATVLLPPNIEAFFDVEDVVVLSEGLIARLGGRPF